MIFQERYCWFKDCWFVHLPIVGWHHCAQFIDQHIELVSPLLFAKVASPPNIILLSLLFSECMKDNIAIKSLLKQKQIYHTIE